MWVDPVAVTVLGMPIRWYGIAWACGFLFMLYCPPGRVRCHKALYKIWPDIVCNALLASVVGGRVGEMLFYQWHHLLHSPLSIFYVWQGGMSFHGALLCGMGMILWMSRRYNIHFWDIADAAVINLPIPLGLVRVANFINGELWGRPTDHYFGVVFPHAGDLARHPSQLYEALLEGVLLWAVMYISSRYHLGRGMLSAIFTMTYACMRLWVECYFRQPTYDIFSWISTGQLLTVLMLGGGVLMAVANVKHWQQKT